jgi:hypothetical protein
MLNISTLLSVFRMAANLHTHYPYSYRGVV